MHVQICPLNLVNSLVKTRKNCTNTGHANTLLHRSHPKWYMLRSSCRCCAYTVIRNISNFVKFNQTRTPALDFLLMPRGPFCQSGRISGESLNEKRRKRPEILTVGIFQVSTFDSLRDSYRWFPGIGVSPNHPLVNGCSIQNQTFLDSLIYGKPHIQRQKFKEKSQEYKFHINLEPCIA